LTKQYFQMKIISIKRIAGTVRRGWSGRARECERKIESATA